MDHAAALIQRIEELVKRLEKLEREKEELAQSAKTLSERNEKLESLVEEHGLKVAQKDTKDRLFKFLFGNPKYKAWTLSLYNAVNQTNYTNPDDIEFNTLGDAVYMRMKNDVSFTLAFEMNIWENQSTWNPNMPMRIFLYAGRLYEKYVMMSDYRQYSSSLQPIPRPKCVCFYNGTKDEPEEQILRLSDAYEGEGDIDVRVRMLNINYGKNRELMGACKPLLEYA